MATRALIGTLDPASGRFRGRYVGHDGHPGTLGPVLTRLLARAGSLTTLLDVLTRDHVLWDIVGRVPDNYDRGGLTLAEGYGLGLRADDADPTENTWIKGVLGREVDDYYNTEWGYLFTGHDAATAELVVIDCPGAVELARIPVRDLPGYTARQWADVECGADLSRCGHYAWVHFEVPEQSKMLGTDAYLGRVPLKPENAVGARTGGRTYTLTGSGRSGGYAFGDRDAGKPGHWYASATDDATGARAELAVYRTSPQRPLRGVTLIYPPLHPAAPVPAGLIPPRLDDPGPRYITVSTEPGVHQVHDTHRSETLPGRYDQATAEQAAADLNNTPADDDTESQVP